MAEAQGAFGAALRTRGYYCPVMCSDKSDGEHTFISDYEGCMICNLRAENTRLGEVMEKAAKMLDDGKVVHAYRLLSEGREEE